jgi:hypothetical protein
MPLWIPVLELDALEKNITESRRGGAILYERGMVNTGIPSKQCTDGHHSFAELYEHRYLLWVAYCQLMAQTQGARVWRSKLHADNTMYPDSFVLGLFRVKGEQVTYHLPLRYWDLCDFAAILDKAPEWDGHTPKDILLRLVLQIKGRNE